MYSARFSAWVPMSPMQLALQIRDNDFAQFSEVALAYHVPREFDHGIAGVVVRERQHSARFFDQLLKRFFLA